MRLRSSRTLPGKAVGRERVRCASSVDATCRGDRWPAAASARKCRASSGNVLAARAQRRERERHHVEPIVEVGPERARSWQASTRSRLVAATTRTSTLMRLVAADALDLALLQDAQQLGLHGQRHVADLVEEERAAARALELAAPLLGRAGERAGLVAEQLALDELARARPRSSSSRADPWRAATPGGWRARRAPCRCRARR